VVARDNQRALPILIAGCLLMAQSLISSQPAFGTSANRISNVNQAGGLPNMYTVSHNGAGDPTTLLAPNGGQESWSYDGAGRVTGTSWFTGTTGLFTQTVTLDAAGQRTVSHDSWGTSSYGYDAAGRLTSASYPDGSTEADQYGMG